jgi:hypothetical protein
VDGYVVCLSHPHAKAGRALLINEYMANDDNPVSYKRGIEDHMDNLPKSRNEYLFARFVREHNKQMLSG